MSDATGFKQSPSRQVVDKTCRLLLNANPLSAWVVDLETLSFLEVNQAAIRHYGYSREEFLTMTLKDIWLPEEAVARMDHLPQDPS